MLEALAIGYIAAALAIGISLVATKGERLGKLGFWRQMTVFALAPAIVAVDIVRLVFQERINK